MSELIQGVYAITPERSATWTPDAIVDCVAAALDGGVTLFQCRQKNWPLVELIDFVGELNALCEKYGASLVLNDVQSQVYAEFEGSAIVGVHLGRTDEPVAQARTRLGYGCLIGASCYNDIDLARQAALAGASYIAFGAMYPSSTKPNAVRAGLELFQNAKGLDLPMVAIGGIELRHVPDLIKAGASAVAVVSGLFGIEPDAAQVCRVAQQWVDAVQLND